jgi:copper chaperone CopZ
MSCPDTVHEALEEHPAVHKIEMELDKDEFIVTCDPTKINDETLIETVKRSGFTAEVCSPSKAYKGKEF